MFCSFWAEAILLLTHILPVGNTPYRKRHSSSRTICITPPLLQSILEGLRSWQSFLVRLTNLFDAFFNRKTPQRRKLLTLQINNKFYSKQILIEVLIRIAVRTSMTLWRPSSYDQFFQLTTQSKQTNPQPNPNTTLLCTWYQVCYYYCHSLQGSTRNKALLGGSRSREIDI